MDNGEKHPIRVVARKTGLTPHVIRVWEKRYGAVTPGRTETNRRLYSDADVERLRLLRQATVTGRSIGQIAALPTETLRALVAADAEAPTSPAPPPTPAQDSSSAFLEECLEAVHHLDAAALDSTLSRAAVALSQPVLIEQVIVPLLHRIGDLWRTGALRVAHEHLASAAIRSSLWNLNRTFAPSATAPTMIVTTPAGQVHELGALMVATTAAWDGWRVTYLGPSLPAEEIAAAARRNHARAVALSIVYPSDDPHLRDELMTLRRGLGDEVVLLIGGRAAEAYADVLDRIDAVRVRSIADLWPTLERLRQLNDGAPR